MSCPYLKKSNRFGKVFYMCKILGKGIHLDKKGKEMFCDDKKIFFSCPFFIKKGEYIQKEEYDSERETSKR